MKLDYEVDYDEGDKVGGRKPRRSWEEKKTQLEPLKNAFLLCNLILLFPCARFYLM